MSPLRDCFLLFLIAVVVIAPIAVVGHVDMTPQEYWKKVLPNTPIPNSILKKLHPDEKTGNYVYVGKGCVPTSLGTVAYHYRAATANELHDDSNVSLYFLEKDLQLGFKFNVNFPKCNSGPNFLPRKEVDAIPFSSSKISEILKIFSIDRNSNEAKAMMETQKDCEKPTVRGEDKYCATSLESMIDFTISKLGEKKIKVISTEVLKKAPKQQYTITSGLQKMGSSKSVVCHIEPYVHAVYYCHALLSDTSTYLVPLVGEDKTKVNAVAVCHKDTSQWNSKHVAFLKLKVKPGSVPICHFISDTNIAWVQN